MSASKDVIRGVVIEALPNSEFRVEIEAGKVARCYMSGKMRMNKIRVLLGDVVEIVLPLGSSIGRITRRR